MSNNISKSQAQNLIENSKGSFLTAIFITKKGEERVLNGKYYKSNVFLGYIKIKERSGTIKNVNLQTLKSLSVLGHVYNVR